jgi:hypothetical protein
MSRVVRVYGRTDCGKCTSLKDKLKKLRVEYEERDIDLFTGGHAGWADDGSVELMVHLCMLDSKDMVDGHVPIPIVSIENDNNGHDFFSYSGAIKRLKELGYKTGSAGKAPVQVGQGAEAVKAMAAVA